MGWDWYELVWNHLKQPTTSLKIAQIILTLIIMMIFRFGSDGTILDFSVNDPDAQIIGEGACVAFLIITPALLLAHFMDKVDNRRPFLEMVLSIVGASLFLIAGAMAIDSWRQVDIAETGSEAAEALDAFEENSAADALEALAGNTAADDAVYSAEKEIRKVDEWTPESYRSSALAMGCLTLFLSVLHSAHAYFSWRQLHDPGNLPS